MNGFSRRSFILQPVERLDGQGIILVLASSKGKVAVRVAQVGLKLDCGKKFLLRIRKFLLLEERLAQALVKAGVATFEAVSPEVQAARSFQKLAGDAHPVGRLPHTALEHIAHAERTPDLFYVDGSTLIGEILNYGR